MSLCVPFSCELWGSFLFLPFGISIFLSPSTPDLFPLLYDQSVYAFLMNHLLCHMSAEDTASQTWASAESSCAGVAAVGWNGCDLSFLLSSVWDGVILCLEAAQI